MTSFDGNVDFILFNADLASAFNCISMFFENYFDIRQELGL